MMKQKPLFSHYSVVNWVVALVCLFLGLPLLTMAQEEAAKRSKLALVGTVTDRTNQPISGAMISEKGTENETATDSDGNFRLTVDPQAILVVAYLGYESQELDVSGRTTFHIVLEETNTLLDQVVVVGYGSQKKASITGAVAAVTSDEIVTTKNENLMNTLTGKLAGVRVVQNSAEPGAFNNSFYVRNMGTPLMIIDGVPRDNMTRINPEDVESITVLKDAASAAVYGVRAANGVVLITTKQGVDQKIQLKYSGYATLQQPSGFPKTIDAIQYMTLLNEKNMHSVDNPQLIFSDEDFAPYLDGTLQTTDWYGQLIKETVPQSQHTLSATGGTSKINYYLSLGKQFQDGFLKSGALNYDRYNIRSNISSQLTNRIKVGLNVSAIMEQRMRPYEGMDQINRSFWRSSPKDPVFANDNPGYFNNGTVDASNPLAMSDTDVSGYRQNKNKWIQSNFNIEYKVPYLEGLTAKGMFSYDYNTGVNKNYMKTYSIYKYNAVNDSYVETLKQSPATIRREFNEGDALLYNVSLNYHRLHAEKHEVGGLLLFEEQRRRGDNFYVQRGLPLPLDQLFAGSSDNILGNADMDGVYENANRAVVGRATYGFDSKYLAEVSFRYDASSKFSRNSTWVLFPSASLGWRISEENFWKNSGLSNIDNLKLRFSYGKVGDDGALNYQWLAGYSYPVDGTPRKKPGGYVIDGKFIAASDVLDVINPAISWTESKTSNLGIDLDTRRGLFGLTVDVFRRNRTGLLATRLRQLPGIVGAGLPQENLESDRTEGFEVEARHRNAINAFTYSLSGTFSFARSRNSYRVQEEAGNSYENWRNSRLDRYNDIGWGRTAAGRYESWEQILNSPVFTGTGTLIGDYIYEDWNQDGEISSLDTHPIAYADRPLISYGLTANLAYKGVDFNVLFQGAAITSVAYNEQLYQPMWGSNTGSSLVQFMDRWHPVDPKADPYAHSTQWVSGHYAYTGTNPDADSEFNRQNASYLRVKSIEIGYTITKNMAKAIGINSVRVYANGYNLLTFTKLNALDPEHPSSSNGYLYPLNKTFSFGLDVNF